MLYIQQFITLSRCKTLKFKNTICQNLDFEPLFLAQEAWQNLGAYFLGILFGDCLPYDTIFTTKRDFIKQIHESLEF